MPVWAKRHRTALDKKLILLIQEHASFEHVFWTGEKFVTFDLEVAYRYGSISNLIAKEITGYLRSFLKNLNKEERTRWLKLFIQSYPDKEILQSVPKILLNSDSIPQRLSHSIDRALFSGKRRCNRYEIAEEIAALL